MFMHKDSVLHSGANYDYDVSTEFGDKHLKIYFDYWIKHFIWSTCNKENLIKKRQYTVSQTFEQTFSWQIRKFVKSIDEKVW